MHIHVLSSTLGKPFLEHVIEFGSGRKRFALKLAIARPAGFSFSMDGMKPHSAFKRATRAASCKVFRFAETENSSALELW